MPLNAFLFKLGANIYMGVPSNFIPQFLNNLKYTFLAVGAFYTYKPKWIFLLYCFCLKLKHGFPRMIQLLPMNYYKEGSKDDRSAAHQDPVLFKLSLVCLFI
jgi:hypothetical protein